MKYSALESRFFGDVFKSSLDNDLSGYDGKCIDGPSPRLLG